MNEKQQDFDEVRRLLKLKRFEVPPPGYFGNFSGTVISRIRAGEGGSQLTSMERLQRDTPWLVNFLRIFETRSGLVGGFATGLCLLLLLGVVVTEHSDRAAKNILTDATQPAAQPDNSLASLTPPAAAAPVLVAAADPAGTNLPIASLQPAASLFGQPGGNNLFQPVSFVPAR